MYRFFIRHKYAIRIFAYISLIFAAFELGKYAVTKNYFDMFLFLIFIMSFLYVKIYEKIMF